MGSSWLQRSPRASLFPCGVVAEHHPAQIPASATAIARRTQELALSRSEWRAPHQEQRRATLAQFQRSRDPSIGKAAQKGGSRLRASPLVLRPLVSLAAAAASQDTDGPGSKEQGLTPQQQDIPPDTSSSIDSAGGSAGRSGLGESTADHVLGLRGQTESPRTSSRTSAAFEEASKIVRIHSRLYSAARNSDEVLWVTLRSSSLLFTALAALAVAVYRDISDPQFRASQQAELQRFAAEQPEQAFKRVKEMDYLVLTREVATACRETAVRVWAATPGPVRWPAAVL